MIAFTRSENGLSNRGRVDYPKDLSASRELLSKRTNLSTAKHIVTWKVEDVRDQLRNGISPYPQEDGLTVFDEVQPMPLQSFRRQRQGWRHDGALFPDSPTLAIILD